MNVMYRRGIGDGGRGSVPRRHLPPPSLASEEVMKAGRGRSGTCVSGTGVTAGRGCDVVRERCDRSDLKLTAAHVQSPTAGNRCEEGRQ